MILALCKSMRVSLFFIIVFVFSARTYANGDSGERVLNSVRLVGETFIALDSYSSDFNNPDSCDKSHRAMVLVETAGSDKKLSLALSALIANKKVGMWFAGCTSTPWGYTVPLISSIYVTR